MNERNETSGGRRAEDYSKREVDSLISGVTGRFDIRLDDQDKILERIETAVNKTNGTVADVKAWKERATGAYVASAVFMTVIVIPILSWAVWSLVHLPETIKNSVDEAITSYQIETNE